MKHILDLSSDDQKKRAINWILKAPIGWIVEFREKKRSDEQNRLMWSLINDIVKAKAEVDGRRFNAEQWKCMFMQALGHQVEVLPTLDGKSWFPSGFRSSQLSVGAMNDLITFIYAYGDERGIAFKEPKGATE